MAWVPCLTAQGLLDEMEEEPVTREFTHGTFETTRMINGQSIENPAPHVLLFMIQHRFGPVNSGLVNFYGLDQSNIRLAFDYGITENLAVGIGRSSNPKTLDGFVKYRFLRQSTGKVNMPISASIMGEAAMGIAPFIDQNRDNKFSDRMAYSYQLIVARKFHKRFSLQVAPTYVHKNLVPRATDSNDIFVAAVGARFKFSKRSSITAEYGYILPVGQVPDYAGRQVRNSASIGMDIETGGHVFQFQLTNSLAVFNRAIWTETTDDWLNGGIHLGFNISRVFDLKR